MKQKDKPFQRKRWHLFGPLAPVMAAAWFLTVTPVNAQSGPAAEVQASDWRQANEVVGKFLRGHIDILRAEARSAQTPQAGESLAVGEPLTLVQAKRLMLQARPSLFASGSESEAERRAHAVAVTMSLASLKRAWVQAVAAQRLLQYQQQASEASDIADELAQRMGKLGNWGADRVLAVGLQASAERLKLFQAQERAAQTRAALAQWVMTDAFALPEQLPALRGLGARNDLNANTTQLAQERLNRLPDYESDLTSLARLEAVAGESSLQQWEKFKRSRVNDLIDGQGVAALTVDRSQVLWNHELREVLQKREAMAARKQETLSTMAVAQAAVKSRHAQTLLLANEFAPLAMQAEEEAVYQYNGMFISTWHLLDQFRARVAVEMALTESQMSYWEAEYAYEAYLAGAPYQAPTGGGASMSATGASGGGHEYESQRFLSEELDRRGWCCFGGHDLQARAREFARDCDKARCQHCRPFVSNG